MKSKRRKLMFGDLIKREGKRSEKSRIKRKEKWEVRGGKEYLVTQKRGKVRRGRFSRVLSQRFGRDKFQEY